MYGYIYKTTNLINGKIYIGQHKCSSWDNNYKGSGTVLFRAFNKYGFDNFKCELLETVESQEELNNREKYYIDLFDSRNTLVGYNISEGGIGGSHPAWNKGLTKETSESVNKYTKSRNKLFKEKSSIGCFGLKGSNNKNSIEYKGTIEKILPEFEDYWKYHFKSEVCAYFHTTPRAYNKCLEILSLDDNNLERKEFLNKKRHDKRLKTINQNNSSNKVKIRCIETNEVYDSILEARLALGLKSSSSLHNALVNGKCCKGFHWERI